MALMKFMQLDVDGTRSTLPLADHQPVKARINPERRPRCAGARPAQQHVRLTHKSLLV